MAEAKVKGPRNSFLEAWRLNTEVPLTVESIYFAGWLVVLLVVWYTLPSLTIIPKPLEIMSAWLNLVQTDGLLAEAGISFILFLEATVISVVISLVMAYSWTIPAMRAPIVILSKLRYWSIYGLTIIFTLIMSGSHAFKISLMVFGLCTFFVTGMAKVVAAVSQEEIDYARNLRMTEWEVVWHVIIVGKLEAMIEIVRQNSAIGWMMLAMVEGYAMGEGGLGSMIVKYYRVGKMSNIYAVQFTIFGAAILQDWLIKHFRYFVCPHMKFEERG